MDSEHYQLLLNSEIRLLSRGIVLSRLFELKDEVRLFFIEHKSFSLSEHVNDYSWLAILAYLSNIFTHLNALNLSLQEIHVTIFNVEDKIEAIIKKLELWSLRLCCARFNLTEKAKTYKKRENLIISCIIVLLSTS